MKIMSPSQPLFRQSRGSGGMLPWHCSARFLQSLVTLCPEWGVHFPMGRLWRHRRSDELAYAVFMFMFMLLLGEIGNIRQVGWASIGLQYVSASAFWHLPILVRV